MRKIINNNKYYIYLKKQLHKFIVVLVVVSIFFNILNLKEIIAYYNDTETSSGNSFVAGLVDFILEDSDWQPVNIAVSMTPGDTTKKIVKVDSQDSNPFKYYTESTNETGDIDFCNGLNVIAKLEGVEMYNGPINNLLTIPTTVLDSWEFTYTTNTDFQNKVCDFDINYNGWQTRHDFPIYENGGYSDTEKVSNHLASWGFRINKIYYDVESPERGTESINEWVEIYNQTNTPLDISGWKICDGTSCDTIPTTPLIPALKYAIIVADSTTVSNLLPAYWYLPSEVTKINIDSNIGNGLSNDADMLALKRPDGIIVDQINWGTPNTNWTNYNANVWNLGAVDITEGNVLARVSSGYDTDQASDWKELKPPSVDLTYPDEDGSYTWYWNNSYTITWIAKNNNGDDNDLNIGIFYVKDVDGNNIISSEDTTFTITETTTNDGSLNWTVPTGFTGYIWIYLIATGPENPMINSGTVSGKIYDPIPIFIGPEDIVVPELLIEDIIIEPKEETLLVAEEPVTTDTILEEIINVVSEVIVETPPAIKTEEIVTKEVVKVIEILPEVMKEPDLVVIEEPAIVVKQTQVETLVVEPTISE
ncbi:MAG: lamin tail domain-containing protein [Candidatus Paceibacterota bacterium]